MKFRKLSKPWKAVSQSDQQLHLRNQLGALQFKPGWQRIVLRAKNVQAMQVISHRARFMLKQNKNFQGASLHTEAAGKLALVFYRHSPLQEITLNWSLNTASFDESAAAKFDLVIKPVTSARAWQVMLATVSDLYRLRGESRTRIYLLSRARQKRAGTGKALDKLIEAYQPLLSYQMISSDPYQYWRDKTELSLPKPPTSFDTHFNIIEAHSDEQTNFTRKGDPAGPAGNDLTTMLEQQSHTSWQLEPAPPSDFNRDSWYCWMNSQDRLAPDALARIAEALPSQPQAQIVYSDHDLISYQQERHSPSFKPDWNPDMCLSRDYVGPAVWFKGELLQQIAVHESPYINVLRALYWLRSQGREEHKAILHISEILYHQHETNVPRNLTTATPDNTDLHDALSALVPNHQGINFPLPGIQQVIYPVPGQTPKVSILIPTRDARLLTETCVTSVLNHTSYRNFEIIILDNGSTQQDTLNWFAEISQHPKVRIERYDHPFNYSAINNFGASKATGELICLLNNDTEVASEPANKDWLTNMVRHALRPEIGCVGAKLYFFDDTVQHAGVVLGLWGLAGHGHKFYVREDEGYQRRLVCEQNYSAVTAACLLVRKELYDEVGGLNENELKVAFNDVDLCLKIKEAGYRNLWTPYAELYHYESKTRGKDDTPEKKARERVEINYMQERWGAVIEQDPAYSPHLTKVREDFGIKL